jgi:serine/threonine protein kinase
LSGSPPSGTPPEHNPALEAAAAEIARLSAGRFEVLGPLGRDPQEVYAFLAHAIGGAEHLTVLKAVANDPFQPPALEVIDQLDASVPPPAGSCPVCQSPFRTWDPSCPDCGAHLAGAPVESEEALARLRSAVRTAAQGYQVLGDMRRATGGGVVFFARELPAGQIVALRLDQEDGSDQRPRYTVAATRMMRPKLMYGAVGGEAGQLAGWSPTPTPSVSLPRGDFGAKICPQCGDSFEGDLRFCPKDGSALRVGAAEGLIGHVVAERYRILEKLGEGGMGRVYLAEHIHMGRRCAVKVMSPALLHDPDSISRFAREAANASRINHPNVAAIYDFGETADRIVYLAMELVEGGSLAHLLERERALPAWRAVDIGQQVADALTAAHEFGIVHRDLKPDNIMLARSSRTGNDLVKVVDFGIAKAKKGGNQTVTRTGFVVGTPAYMSPEQILGDELDGRSDIYSLGCILFEMLTGERAFAGPSGEVVIRKRLTENPPPPSGIRRDLGRNVDAIVTRAMARSPDQRFGSAAELREALQAAAAESGSQSWWRSLLPGRGVPQTVAESKPARLATHPASAGTAPVPVGWSEAMSPGVPAGAPSTMLRHRSARPDRRITAWLVGGSLLVVLAGFLGWRVLGSSGTPATPTMGGPAAPPPPSSEPASAGDAPQALQEGPPAAVPPDSVRPSTPVATAGGAPADSAALDFGSLLPPDARVTVDGKQRTVPPSGRLIVGPGTHAITVRAPGYRTGSQRVAVAPGEIRPLTLTPAREAPAPGVIAPAVPASGTIVVAGDIPPAAELRVDGKVLPPGTRVVTVQPGSHRVVLSSPGYGSDSTQLDVRPDERAQWVVPPRLASGAPTTQGSRPAASPPAAEAGPPVRPESPPAKPSAGTEPTASRDVGLEAGARALIETYARAINARNIGQLRAMYPAMTPERERQWRDLFRGEVKDLTAAVSAIRVVPGDLPQAEFVLTLTFRPERGKPQSFRVNNHAALRQDPSGWHLVHLDEKGD